MVLEELYSVDFIKKKPYFAFLLGISYSIIGMGAAIFLFPDDPALVAVAIAAMLMLPLLRRLVSSEEGKLGFFKLIKQNSAALKIYALLFLGSFVTFAFFSMMLPKMAANFLFQNQFNLYFGSITGKAFSSGMFFELFNNNLRVLMFSFIFSLIMGGGAIFIIIWNASLWGTIFGMLAKTAAFSMGGNQWFMFGTILLIVFPHMILEVFSYIVSAVSGSVASSTILNKEFMSKEFKESFYNAVVLLLVAAVILIIAMAVETYVLQSIGFYRQIISTAFA